MLEVSSHSLSLKRVHGCAFKVAVFTNLTRDHLDFHGDMESYFAAKRTLFADLLRADGCAVINLDDEHGEELRQASRGRVIDLRPSSTTPTCARRRWSSRSRGPASSSAPAPTASRCARPWWAASTSRTCSPPSGRGFALGVPPEDALRGIASLSGVPGRLQRVDAGQDFAVVVDYAHTDDALKNLLETLRELQPRKLITVFGCGGDRDKTKRPLMGAVASRLSDLVIATSDNPRSEPPEAILQEIGRGMPAGRAAQTEVIVDRREAIARALELAGPGDVVVIAGKGHETYQVLRDRTVPFDDRQVALDALGRLLVKGARR